MKVNKPEFITAVRIPENIHFNLEDNAVKMTVKTMVQRINEDVNSTILKGIYETAKDHGITDLFLINEQNVVQALKKQIPVKPIEDGYYDEPCVCPNCGSNVINEIDNDYRFEYCYHCGQALDWSEDGN